MDFSKVFYLLPFHHVKEESNRQMLSKIKEICGTTKYAIYLIEKAFPNLFSPESFLIVCQEHERIFSQNLSHSRLTGRTLNEDKHFADVLAGIFEKVTQRKTADNQKAFKLLLSLVRRRYNEKLRKQHTHAAKERNRGIQGLLLF